MNPGIVAGPAVWENYVPAAEIDRLSATGFGGPVDLGARPCLLVIDVTSAFLGPRPDGEATDDFPLACGKAGWERLPEICGVLDVAREAGIPRVLTRGSPDAVHVGGAITLSRNPELARRAHEAGFPPEIVPRADEFVLAKTKASAFFGTPLLTFLHQHRVDGVIVVGTTTSGCVRATAVDAASHGFPVLVAEDACFDRSPFAHAANLFDIQMKYGSVISAEALRERLSALSPCAADGPSALPPHAGEPPRKAASGWPAR